MLKTKAQAQQRTSLTNLILSSSWLKLLLTFMLYSTLSSCNESKNNFRSYPKGVISLPSGNKITVFIANSAKEQSLGLSHVKEQDLKDNEAMLFPAKSMGPRQFWMPETHINLDLFFMNRDFYILDIHRNLQAFPKKEPRNKIPRSKTVYSQHVLEMKSSSELAKELDYGMILKIDLPKDFTKGLIDL